MEQQFHALRCFSCKTFQVQQVKKSKKWSCNMCGEKQSLIKEYGRGTGADCRRHVQKLNSLCGELLEVDNERAWTHWEKEEECEVEASPGDETSSWQQKGQTAVVSRWSKYVGQKENGPESEEDEYEEKRRVYTDTEQCRQHNISRKRKKSFTSGAINRRYNVEEDQDKDTVHGGTARQKSPHRRHDVPFDSTLKVPCPSTGSPPACIRQRTDFLCASSAASLCSEGLSAHSDACSQFTGTSNKQSCAKLSTKPQHSVPLSSFSAPSFHQQQPSKTKLEARDSKWARFLTSVCVAAEDEEDIGEHAQCLDDHTALVQSLVMPVATVPPNTDTKSSGRRDGALLYTVRGVEKVTVFEKLSPCENGNVCKQPPSPSIASKPVGSLKPVCVQPLPKPALSFSTLFHTDEDFDDSY